MIAAVHPIRTIVILAVLLVSGLGVLYYGTRWFARELRDKPYVANVKTQLRALAAAEEAFRRDSLSYTNEILRVWRPVDSTQGVTLRILSAGPDGFLAEGRHTAWTG